MGTLIVEEVGANATERMVRVCYSRIVDIKRHWFVTS